MHAQKRGRRRRRACLDNSRRTTHLHTSTENKHNTTQHNTTPPQKQTKQTSKLFYFKYPVAGSEDEFLPVATTRPETILGDAAVCVHPDDPRCVAFSFLPPGGCNFWFVVVAAAAAARSRSGEGQDYGGGCLPCGWHCPPCMCVWCGAVSLTTPSPPPITATSTSSGSAWWCPCPRGPGRSP